MMRLKSFVLAGVIAVSGTFAATDADALFLDGVFSIDLYNYDSEGVSANANATQANVDNRTLLATVTWDGLLNFNVTGNLSPVPAATTIEDFFRSGTGTITGLNASVGNLLLSGGAGGGDAGGLASSGDGNGTTFRETTLFKFTALSFRNISDMSQIINVRHDDGFTLTDGVTSVAFATPTPPINTPVSGLTGSFADFNLIYAAANGNPSVLEVNVVPLPAALWLLLGVSGALVAAKRRSVAKAA